VAAELECWLPSPDILAPDERDGDPEGYRSYVLHSEPDGTFSIVALVWRPDQETPIHDHVTCCVFGVLQGVEYEELFMLDEANGYLVQAGTSVTGLGT
jgi:3-mercaptopropionate dioxygenase